MEKEILTGNFFNWPIWKTDQPNEFGQFQRIVAVSIVPRLFFCFSKWENNKQLLEKVKKTSGLVKSDKYKKTNRYANQPTTRNFLAGWKLSPNNFIKKKSGNYKKIERAHANKLMAPYQRLEKLNIRNET